MAKTPGKSKSKVEAAAEAAEQAVAQAQETSAVKSRGPRGVPDTAVISGVVPNPKREGSKAQQVFAHYRDGMTVAEFVESLKADGLDKEATPNLVYDAKHGFIKIEGYDPGEIVVAKPKAEKKPAAEKKVKAAKKVKTAEEFEAAAAADTTAAEEVME